MPSRRTDTSNKAGRSERQHVAGLTGVEQGVEAFIGGALVVLVDDAGLAALAIAAEHVDASAIASMTRNAGGWVFLSLTPERCVELDLLPEGYRRADDLALDPKERKVTATISAVERVGIRGAAGDKAHSIRKVSDPTVGRDELVSPGRIQPVCVHEAGVRGYQGRAEAAVDLARLAGLTPAAVLCDIIDDNGVAAPAEQIRALGQALGLVTVSVAEVLEYRRLHEMVVERVVSTRLPTASGTFVVVGYRSLLDGTEYLAMLVGDVEGASDVLLHLHTRCLTGDVFHSLRCDCADQLDSALGAIEREGRGVLVYRAHDARDPDVHAALRGYAEREAGELAADSPHVALELDEYEPAAAIIKDLGLGSVRLLTADPDELDCLDRYGVPARLPAPAR
jgi:3,4-dihydroxy 2-butanone 4-phosphate synthase / GTP cyclohydrolase II